MNGKQSQVFETSSKGITPAQYFQYLFNKELNSFIQIFNMSPNCLVCSPTILNYLAHPEDLLHVKQNTFFKGFRIAFVEKHLLYWFLANNERDLDSVVFDLNGTDVDLFRDMEGVTL